MLTTPDADVRGATFDVEDFAAVFVEDFAAVFVEGFA
jgi:hypothetical protein